MTCVLCLSGFILYMCVIMHVLARKRARAPLVCDCDIVMCSGFTCCAQLHCGIGPTFCVGKNRVVI